MTARQEAQIKRIKGEQSKKAIKVCELVFERMVVNRMLADFDSMLRLTMLCRKLHKSLDLNKALLYISEDQRYNLYLRKASVFSPAMLKKVDDAIKQL